MEIEITENNQNPLLKRKEIHLVIKHDSKATPKRSQVIKSLAEKLKAKKELIIIAHLKNMYGKTETQGYAKIYANYDELNLIETRPSIARHTDAGDKPKKEKKVEEPPKEDTKEVSEEKTSEEAVVKESGETNEKD